MLYAIVKTTLCVTDVIVPLPIKTTVQDLYTIYIYIDCVMYMYEYIGTHGWQTVRVDDFQLRLIRCGSSCVVDVIISFPKIAHNMIRKRDRKTVKNLSFDH